MNLKTLRLALIISMSLWIGIACICHAEDNLTIPTPPQLRLMWDNATVDSWEVVIADNTCHIGGKGLKRTMVTKKKNLLCF